MECDLQFQNEPGKCGLIRAYNAYNLLPTCSCVQERLRKEISQHLLEPPIIATLLGLFLGLSPFSTWTTKYETKFGLGNLGPSLGFSGESFWDENYISEHVRMYIYIYISTIIKE